MEKLGEACFDALAASNGLRGVRVDDPSMGRAVSWLIRGGVENTHAMLSLDEWEKRKMVIGRFIRIRSRMETRGRRWKKQEKRDRYTIR